MRTPTIRKWPHICLTALLSAYLTFVILSEKLVHLVYQQQIYGAPNRAGFYLFFSMLFFVLCFFLLHWLSQNVKSIFKHNAERSKLSSGLFAGVAIAALGLNLLYLIGHYPGGISPDTLRQWEQAHTLAIDDHHPFFHTYLYILLTNIVDSYTFMLVVQNVVYALALGYLAATMYAWGYRFSLVIAVCSAIALNTQTRTVLMYFWKDSTLSVLFLFLLSHIVNLFLTRGAWLKKASHWGCFAALLACITLVRHNAVLFTGPLLVLLLVYLPDVRRACIKTVLTVLLLIFCVKGPLQSAYHVSPSSDTYLETTGLPMTILCSVYSEAPENMSPEAYQFMEQFADQASLQEHYVFGDYNSAKWTLSFTQEKLAQTSIKDFLNLTLDTIKRNPVLSALSVLELTDMVWDPMDNHYQYTQLPETYQPLPSPYSGLQSACSGVSRILDMLLDDPLIQKPTAQLGFLLLVMLLALYLSIHNVRGWSALWLILPVMCYNFGTMLLLCGNDYRFFHFNCFAVWPLVVLMLSSARPVASQNETCKSK